MNNVLQVFTKKFQYLLKTTTKVCFHIIQNKITTTSSNTQQFFIAECLLFENFAGKNFLSRVHNVECCSIVVDSWLEFIARATWTYSYHHQHRTTWSNFFLVTKNFRQMLLRVSSVWTHLYYANALNRICTFVHQGTKLVFASGEMNQFACCRNKGAVTKGSA